MPLPLQEWGAGKDSRLTPVPLFLAAHSHPNSRGRKQSVALALSHKRTATRQGRIRKPVSMGQSKPRRSTRMGQGAARFPPKREQEPAQPDPIRPPMPVQPVPMTNNLRVRLGETGGQRPAAGHSAPSLPSHPIKEQQENPAVQAWLRQAAPEYLPSLRARVLTPNPAMFRIPAAGRLCGSASRSSRIGRRRYLPRKGLPVEISRMAAHLQRPSPIHPPGIRFMRLAAVLFLRGKSPPVRLWAGGSIRIVAVSLHPAWQECGRPPAAAVHPVVMQFPPVQQERVFTPEAGLF